MSDRPSAVAGLEVTEVTAGLVVYQDSSDSVHYLNGTASVVFTLCDGRRNREAIAHAVAVVFGADAVSPGSLAGCLTELHEAGLIE